MPYWVRDILMTDRVGDIQMNIDIQIIKYRTKTFWNPAGVEPGNQEGPGC